MFTVKDIIVGTYENYYKRNIQLQFLGDSKFVQFMHELCEAGSDYQQTLADYSSTFNINAQLESPNKHILNSIGGLLGLPPMEYFSFVVDGERQGISISDYINLIKGQQLKNTWDGTNEGILSGLNLLFPEYEWGVVDNGDMSINIFITQKETPFDIIIINLFKGGWFTPKPAGVKVSYNVVDFAPFMWDETETGVLNPETGVIEDEPTTWDNGKWI